MTLQGERPIITAMETPVGLDGIEATFGDIHDYIRDDGTLSSKWEGEQLAVARLSLALPLSWKPTKIVTCFRVHRKTVAVFEEVFDDLRHDGLLSQLREFGGAFNYRSTRGAPDKLSTHAWGIAIDLNPRTNQRGTRGDMSRDVVAVFQRFGFLWGGGWPTPDPMHFQLARGY